MTLGQRICKFRKERNLSQGDLADALEVSRQSISKWETDSSVPELDKLVKLADVFEISLDALVRGEYEQPEPNEKTTERQADEVIDTEPYRAREAHCEKADQNVRYQEIAFPPRKIVGTILLCMGALIFVLLTAFGGIIEGLLLALPFVLCGVICFVFRRRVGLWCAWTLYFLVDIYLRQTTSIDRDRVYLTLLGAYEFDLGFIISLIWLLCLIALIAISIYSFRRYKTDFNRSAKTKIVLSVVCVVVSEVVSFILFNILKDYPYHEAITVIYSLLSIFNSIIDWLQIFAITMLIIVISAIVRKRKENG